MKKILILLGIVVMLGYIIYALNSFSKKVSENICNDVVVTVTNSNEEMKYFIDANRIKEELLKNKLNPKGKKIEDINTWDIENYILSNEHAKSAKIYFTNNNNLEIKINEKKPIIRIVPNTGAGYYLDEDGKKMKLSDTYTTYVPIVTGNISDSIVLKEIYIFAQYLNNNEFWDAQIDQIIVDKDQDIKLITRVGGHLINIGSFENIDTKLRRLFVFYKEGLNQFGWNKYSSINLKFDNQVVCVE